MNQPFEPNLPQSFEQVGRADHVIAQRLESLAGTGRMPTRDRRVEDYLRMNILDQVGQSSAFVQVCSMKFDLIFDLIQSPKIRTFAHDYVDRGATTKQVR